MPEQSYNKPRLVGLTPRQAYALFLKEMNPPISVVEFIPQEYKSKNYEVKFREIPPLRAEFTVFRKKHIREIREKLDYYGERCRYCRVILVEGDNLSWDHAIPVVRGGSNIISNLMPCCRMCNSKKGAKSFLEFLGSRS